MKEIKLGSTVKCTITGFVGVAVARTTFINGCVQYNVVPKAGKDGKFPEEMNIDEGSLEIIDIKKPKVIKQDTGGPSTKGSSMKGF